MRKEKKMASDALKIECRIYEAKYPVVDQFVMVQVKSITRSGAWVSLLEYDNIEGLLLISEPTDNKRRISSFFKLGRIRPVRVSKVDEESGRVLLNRETFPGLNIRWCKELFSKSMRVHTIMRLVAETMRIDLQDLYIHVAWPLHRKYGHAFEAFKLILKDPDSMLESLTREVKEVGPDGQEVMKLVPAITDEVKDSLVKNIRRKMTPRHPLNIRAYIKIKFRCRRFYSVDLRIMRALHKAEGAGTEDCPVKIKRFGPQAYALYTLTLDEHKGIQVLNEAIEACKNEIARHEGRLVVAQAPTVLKRVNKHDDSSRPYIDYSEVLEYLELEE